MVQYAQFNTQHDAISPKHNVALRAAEAVFALGSMACFGVGVYESGPIMAEHILTAKDRVVAVSVAAVNHDTQAMNTTIDQVFSDAHQATHNGVPGSAFFGASVVLGKFRKQTRELQGKDESS